MQTGGDAAAPPPDLAAAQTIEKGHGRIETRRIAVSAVLSELRKRKRNLGLVAWLEKTAKRRPVLSVISVGEIERGIARHLTNPDFSMALATWLDKLLTLYGERILPFELEIARRWGVLSGILGNESADLMIAATALERGLTVVMRNVPDFKRSDVPVLDPFE